MNEDLHKSSQMSDDAESKSLSPQTILQRKLNLSRFALVIEGLWPRLWWPIGVLAVFSIASISGLWLITPPLLHKILLVLFGIFFVLSLMPVLFFKWPSKEQAVRRLEENSGLKNNPITSYNDILGNNPPSRATQKLWRAHKKRVARQFSELKATAPQPRVDKHDPFALRALVILVLAVCVVATGKLIPERIYSAFDFTTPSKLTIDRIDAWVTPPVYTRRAPIMLANASKQTNEQVVAKAVSVPENSQLIIQN